MNIKSKLNLKPCPHCGGKMKFKYKFYEVFSDQLRAIIPQCEKCRTEYPEIGGKDIQDAIQDIMIWKALQTWRKE